MKNWKHWKGKDKDHMCHGWCMKCHGGKTGSVYFLGFIGAAVYYIQAATGFWGGVVGVLKALVWPAFLVHKLLGF